MTRLLCVLLMLLFSLSGPAMGENGDFGRSLLAANNGARTFTSTDPLVGSLANKIEAAYPGHVVGVNVPVRNAAGQLVTDADILLQNAVIQVKSGGGKGLTSQLIRTEQATGLPTIGYGPTLKPSLRLVIEGNWGWFAFNLEADLEDEIGDAERTTIRHSISDPSYVQLEFSSACAVNIAMSKFIPGGGDFGGQ